MVRKQVYITQDQDALLKRLAEERGRTEAEVVRMALDNLSPAPYEHAEPEPGRIGEVAAMDRYTVDDVRQATGLAIDQGLADAAWQKELAFIRSLGEAQADRTGEDAWKFSREELYEERLSKILPRH